MARVREQLAAKSRDILGHNIRNIAELEEESLQQRSIGQRLGGRLTLFVGTISYAVLHFLFFAVWILVNTGKIPNMIPL